MGELTILVAESDPSIAVDVERTVISAGFGCVTVCDGKAAQVALYKQNFSLAILDESMSYLKGSELAQWIKSQEHIKTPVILLSNDFSHDSSISENLIAAYLSKPFKMKSLNHLIQIFVRRN